MKFANMNGNGVAFCVFAFCCVALELFGNGAGSVLWFAVLLWAAFGEFNAPVKPES